MLINKKVVDVCAGRMWWKKFVVKSQGLLFTRRESQIIILLEVIRIIFSLACGPVGRALDSRSEGLEFDSQCWPCVKSVEHALSWCLDSKQLPLPLPLLVEYRKLMFFLMSRRVSNSCRERTGSQVNFWNHTNARVLSCTWAFTLCSEQK